MIGHFYRVLEMIPGESLTRCSWRAVGAAGDRKLYSAYTYQQRAYCYLKQRQYATATDDLSEAIKLRPQYPNNYQNRARAHYLLGEKGLADADSKTAKATAPAY